MTSFYNSLSCTHNQRARYTDGFYCMEPQCGRFIKKSTLEYFVCEGASTLWMVLHNRLCEFKRNEQKPPLELEEMADRLWGLSSKLKKWSSKEIMSFRKEVFAFFKEHKIGRGEATVVLGEGDEL